MSICGSIGSVSVTFYSYVLLWVNKGRIQFTAGSADAEISALISVKILPNAQTD
jgi:hypothetical protein